MYIYILISLFYLSQPFTERMMLIMVLTAKHTFDMEVHIETLPLPPDLYPSG